MKAFTLICWIFVVPVHLYVLQPSVDVTVLRGVAEDKALDPHAGTREEESQMTERVEEKEKERDETDVIAVKEGETLWVQPERELQGNDKEEGNKEDTTEDKSLAEKAEEEPRQQASAKASETPAYALPTRQPPLPLGHATLALAEDGGDSPPPLRNASQLVREPTAPPTSRYVPPTLREDTEQAPPISSSIPSPRAAEDVTPSSGDVIAKTSQALAHVRQTEAPPTEAEDAILLVNATGTELDLIIVQNVTDSSKPLPGKIEEVDSTVLASRRGPTVRLFPPSKQANKHKSQLKKPVGKARELKGNKLLKKKEKDKQAKPLKKAKKAKTPKPKKSEEPTTAPYFPYFQDNYCPPECSCYGRVVQCSDKGVEKIPYGIPYNSRYILLMNNRLDSLPLDLLPEYLSMEFLVLSNNRLTDSSVEGAFEGVQGLKRLYLERNLLRGVPTDLPASLEELRLDGNELSVMSESAWERCPGLLVLSLSNNSLGNGSDPLPAGVLSPLGSLRTLNLDRNRLASVPLRLPLSLRELYLRGNRIQRFPADAFQGRAELLVLDLSANWLTEKGLGKGALASVSRLESLNLEGNRLRQVPRYLPTSLKTLNLEGNGISALGKTAFRTLPHLELLGLARNGIARVAPAVFLGLSRLHQLDLSHNALRQVPRRLPPWLNTASLAHNEISTVPRDAFCWGPRPALSGLVSLQLAHNPLLLSSMNGPTYGCLRGYQVIHLH